MLASARTLVSQSDPVRSLLRTDSWERLAGTYHGSGCTLAAAVAATLYDAGVTSDGQPYLALEYVEGVPIDEYVDKVVAGELHDPTLSFQLSHGFEVRGLLENYLEDEADDGWAALIVWENPDHPANH